MTHPDIVRVGWSPDNKLHNFLVALYHLARIPLSLCALVVCLLLAPGALSHTQPMAAAAILGAASLGDLLLLLLLPRLKISFGWVQPPWLLYSAGRSILALLMSLLPLTGRVELIALAGIQGVLTALSLYGSLVEPFWLQHTRLVLQVRGLEAPISALLLTDLHMEHPTRREAAVLQAIEREKPDLIFFVGDLFNLSFVGEPQNLAHTRDFLQQLSAPAGVYYVRGTVDLDPPHLVDQVLEGLSIRRLENEAVEVVHRGARLNLVGIPAVRRLDDRERNLKELLLETPRPVAVLHHLPDLFFIAADLEADLYFGGHTHGGQICIPLLGPPATGSRMGRRFYKGLLRQGKTQGYISRGVGLEGLGAPRMRFLARPELIWLELVPEEPTKP